MNIIITESQYKYILLEESKKSISKTLEDQSSIVKRIIKSAKTQAGLDLTFLLTWGTTIGGFIGPISDFIENQPIKISDTEIDLILTGLILTYFTSNKKFLHKILVIIKEKGLIKIFDEVLTKTEKLEKTFLSFIDSLGITTHKVSNMIAYAFLIPVLPEIYKIATKDFSEVALDDVVKRIISFGALTVSGVMVKELVRKIVDRFRS